MTYMKAVNEVLMMRKAMKMVDIEVVEVMKVERYRRLTFSELYSHDSSRLQASYIMKPIPTRTARCHRRDM